MTIFFHFYIFSIFGTRTPNSNCKISREMPESQRATLQRKSYLCITKKKELRVLSSNFHINVSVSNLYISRIGPHVFLPQNRQTDPGNIQIAHPDTWMWKLGLRPRNSFSGNICFEFRSSVFAVKTAAAESSQLRRVRNAVGRCFEDSIYMMSL